MFTYKATIRLHDTDAAGLIFFANLFKIIYDAYEEFLDFAGFDLAKIIHKSSFTLPVVHAEADYKVPLCVGDKVAVEIKLEKTGTTSFVLNYAVRHRKKGIAATAKTVHVAVSQKTWKTVPLPPKFRRALIKIL